MLKQRNKLVKRKCPFKRRYDKQMNIKEMIIVHKIPHKQRINIGRIQVSFNGNKGVENE